MDILENITPCQRSAVSRAEEIARKIEGLIFDRVVKPGTCLGTKENLRHRFDVSPGTMNEAIRILQVRGIIVTRRGSKGGVFVAASRAQITFNEINSDAALIEQCQAVSHQLEPLLFVEATKAANAGAIAELQQLVHDMAATVDQPIESLRWSWLFYRRIAAIGLNTVLTDIYTTLLTFLERAVGKSVATVANYSHPQHVVATSRELIQAIASGNTHHAAAVAHRIQSPTERSLFANKPSTPRSFGSCENALTNVIDG